MNPVDGADSSRALIASPSLDSPVMPANMAGTDPAECSLRQKNKSFMNSDRIRRILEADDEAERVLIVLFIPSKDRKGTSLKDHEMWVFGAESLLGRLFGGCTAMPPAEGMWFDVEADQLIREEVRLIHSYALVSDVEDEAKMRALSDFLHRMGRQARQGEVAIVIDRVFHRIRKFRKLSDSDG